MSSGGTSVMDTQTRTHVRFDASAMVRTRVLIEEDRVRAGEGDGRGRRVE